MRIQKYLRPHVAYTNRIRPSTRIRFVSGHLKGLVNRAWKISRGKRLVLILWRQRIKKSTDTSVHTYPDTERVQKFPLWRAYTEISGYTKRIRRTRVDARCIRMKKFADTKISGYVWTEPKKHHESGPPKNCLLMHCDKSKYGHTRHCEDCKEVCLRQRTTRRAFWRIWVGVCAWLSGRCAAHTSPPPPKLQNVPPPLPYNGLTIKQQIF